MTPTRLVFDREPASESPAPWPPARDATFESPDDPALIISDPRKERLLKETLGMDTNNNASS